MPTGNRVSRGVQNHTYGVFRLIKEWREDNGEYDITVKDVAEEFEEDFLADYDIEIVVTRNDRDWQDGPNKAVLEALDKLKVKYAQFGLYIPDIDEFNED